MKSIGYIIVLAAARAMMELVLVESAPQWRSYDATQKIMLAGLLVVFAVIGIGAVVLAISELRRERTAPRKIRVY